MGAENAGNETLMRESLASENLCQRFTLPTKKYEVQFSHIYSNRLNALKPLVIATAYEKWPRDAPSTILSLLQAGFGPLILTHFIANRSQAKNMLKDYRIECIHLYGEWDETS